MTDPARLPNAQLGDLVRYPLFLTFPLHERSCLPLHSYFLFYAQITYDAYHDKTTDALIALDARFKCEHIFPFSFPPGPDTDDTLCFLLFFRPLSPPPTLLKPQPARRRKKARRLKRSLGSKGQEVVACSNENSCLFSLRSLRRSTGLGSERWVSERRSIRAAIGRIGQTAGAALQKKVRDGYEYRKMRCGRSFE